MEHTDPAQLGFDPERLERVLGAIDADVAAGRYDGVALCVARRGRVALRAHRGFALQQARGRVGAVMESRRAGGREVDERGGARARIRVILDTLGLNEGAHSPTVP